MLPESTRQFTLAYPVQDVFAVAANEILVHSAIPGAEGSMAQLFGADRVSINPEQMAVVFANTSGHTTTVSFAASADGMTVCSLEGIEHNPRVTMYADIIRNYFVGVALAEYVRKQRQFTLIGRGVTYAFLGGLIIWAFSVGFSSMPVDASSGDWALAAIRLFGIGVPIVAPLAAILPMFFMWPVIELLKYFVFRKPLAAALMQLKRQAPNTQPSQLTYAQLSKSVPALTESVKYLGGYRYTGFLAVVDRADRWLNKLMSFSGESRQRASYKYGVLDMLAYRLVQLNVRDVVWALPLRSDFAHTYIKRKGQPTRSLGGETIELEGDFAKYFTVYAAKGEQVEALRLASPEVMAAMIDHALPFDIEVRKRTLILHTELKQFLDPIWIARSLTAAQRVSHEIDTRGDAPQSHRPLLSAYGVPLLESQPKLTLLYAVPSLIMFMGVVFESQHNEGALAMPLLIPLGIVLGLLMGYLLAMLAMIVLSLWHNRFSASIAGIVDTGQEV